MNFSNVATTLALICVAFPALLSGCGTVNPGVIPGTNEDVLLPDSCDYAERARTFKISPEALRKMVEKNTGRPANLADRPDCIVGRCYVFARPHLHAIELCGEYVNGDTGEWTEKSVEDRPYYVAFDFFQFARIEHFLPPVPVSSTGK